MVAWQLLSGWRPVGVGDDQGGACGWIWECVAAWQLLSWKLSSWRGTRREVAFGEIAFGGMVVWKLLSGNCCCGGGKKTVSGKLSSGRCLRGNCFRDGGQSAGGRSRRCLRVDLGACGRVEMCGKAVPGRVLTAGNGRRRTGKVQKGRKEVRFPAAEGGSWVRDIAFCVSL